MSTDEAIQIGSLWLKNDSGGWHPRPGERHLVRVEQFTPLHRAVLRRMDCDHEFIFDVDTLTTNYDPSGPVTMILPNEKGDTERYPWRATCPVCWWSDTFARLDYTQERAKQHYQDHVAKGDVPSSAVHNQPIDAAKRALRPDCSEARDR